MKARKQGSERWEWRPETLPRGEEQSLSIPPPPGKNVYLANVVSDVLPNISFNRKFNYHPPSIACYPQQGECISQGHGVDARKELIE